MPVPMKTIIDCATGAISEIPLTDEEMAQREIDLANAQAEKEARDAEETRIANLKASAKAKLIAGEALTAEEADTLVI